MGQILSPCWDPLGSLNKRSRAIDPPPKGTPSMSATLFYSTWSLTSDLAGMFSQQSCEVILFVILQAKKNKRGTVCHFSSVTETENGIS